MIYSVDVLIKNVSLFWQQSRTQVLIFFSFFFGQSRPLPFFGNDYFLGQFHLFLAFIEFLPRVASIALSPSYKSFPFQSFFSLLSFASFPISFTFSFSQTSSCFSAMAIPRTPDWSTWDLPSPAIHPARSLGLQFGAEIPLFADTRTHLCGLATGVVSAQFLYFLPVILIKKYWVIVHKHISNDFTERNLIKMHEIAKNWEKIENLNSGPTWRGDRFFVGAISFSLRRSPLYRGDRLFIKEAIASMMPRHPGHFKQRIVGFSLKRSLFCERMTSPFN